MLLSNSQVTNVHSNQTFSCIITYENVIILIFIATINNIPITKWIKHNTSFIIIYYFFFTKHVILLKIGVRYVSNATINISLFWKFCVIIKKMLEPWDQMLPALLKYTHCKKQLQCTLRVSDEFMKTIK